jgi:putative membrane protein
MIRAALPKLRGMLGALIVGAVGWLAVARLGMHGAGGSAAAHMGMHVALMSVIAPLVAWWAIGCGMRPRGSLGESLLGATAAQAALLYLWHLPPGLRLAMEAPSAMAVMQLSLLGAATWFWCTIFGSLPARRWGALAALLVTGKVFCLLGVLLVLAPRPLYAAVALEDQQLAGLIMLAACPLTYLGAALVVTLRGLGGLFRARSPVPVREPAVR